jgi:DNA polymerase III delta prime subunit
MQRINKRLRTSAKRTLNDEVGYQARKIDKILRKLETNPRARYEDVLDDEEINLARLLMRAAVNHLQGCAAKRRGQRFRLPKCFVFCGRRHWLKYSNLGRIFIATKRGVNVLGSDFFAI